MKFTAKVLVHSLLMMSFFAQTGMGGKGQADAGAFLRMGAGAHAKSMGGAFTAIANSPAAAYWNPGGLAQIESISLLASHNELALDRSYTFISGIVPSSRNSSLGISWIGLNVNNIEARSGDTTEPDYYFNSANSAILLSYSYKLSPLFSFGVNYKWLQERLYTSSLNGHGLDLGFFSKLTDTFSAGLMLQDVQSTVRGEGGFKQKFPLIYRLGLAASFSSDLHVAIDFSVSESKYRQFALGMEYRPVAMLPIRAGFNQQGFVFGSGLNLPLQTMNLNLNYSYTQDPLSGSDVHTISVGIGYKPTGLNFSRSRSKPKSRKKYRRPLQYIVVQTKKLNVREGPSTKYGVIGAIHQGQRFRKTGTIGNWVKIQVGKKKYGWVHKKFIKEYIRR